MATTKARATGGDEDQDVEGHKTKARTPEGAAPASGKARVDAGPDEIRGTRESDDDTEGHQFLPNAALSHGAASSREREIQRNLQKRDLKTESRRPFFRKPKAG